MTLSELGVTTATGVDDSEGVTNSSADDTQQVEEQPGAGDDDCSDNSLADSDTATSVSSETVINPEVP